MRHRTLIGLLSLTMSLGFVTACVSAGYKSADEIAPGKSVPQLKRMGWDIGDPTTVDALEQVLGVYSGQDWERFKLLLQPGDQLREVTYKVEHGVAIFRHGAYVSSFLPVIVLK